MHITCKKSMANLKMIDNLIALSDTSTSSMASSANWLDYRIRKLLGWRRDGLSVCYQWQRILSNVATWIL